MHGFCKGKTLRIHQSPIRAHLTHTSTKSNNPLPHVKYIMAQEGQYYSKYDHLIVNSKQTSPC